MARHAEPRAPDLGRVLLSGFDAFGGETINPSLEVVRRLHGERSADGVPIVACELPTKFGSAIDVLSRAIDRTQPSLVIALGQAANRGEVSVERIAINVDDARIPDNAGRQPIDRPVVAEGPAAYFSMLPIKAIVAALREKGIAAGVSQSAGTFVCNHVFYGLCHLIATRWPGVRGGFIHLPLLPEQAPRHSGASGMALGTMVDAVRIAIDVSLTVRVDAVIAAGAVD